MATLSGIRSTIQNRIFSSIGSLAVIYSISESLDKWGDATSTVSSSTDVTCVPYNLLTGEKSYEVFGDLEAGQTVFIFPYDTTITLRDIVQFDAVDYIVEQIEKYPYAGGNLAYQVLCRKVLGLVTDRFLVGEDGNMLLAENGGPLMLERF